MSLMFGDSSESASSTELQQKIFQKLLQTRLLRRLKAQALQCCQNLWRCLVIPF